MTRLLKPVISFLMFFIVLFFIKTILSITSEFADWISTVLALFCSFLAGWYMWQLFSGKKTGIVISVLGSALIFGGLGFIIGFLGPMLLAQDTNKGPLIGIFITGPLGVVGGAISGFVYAYRQKRFTGD